MQKDMTVGKPSKIVISFAVSFLMSNALSYVYNITDSLMLARYVDPNAIGALGSISPIYSVVLSLVNGMISGFCILLGKTYGLGNRSSLRKMAANAILLCTVLLLPLTLLATVFSGEIVSLANTPQSFYSMAKAYISVIFVGLPISAASYLLSGFMRALGDGKSPMKISMLSGAFNVVFNFIFLKIIPLGVAGAALGTLCSGLVGVVLYLVSLKKNMDLMIPKRADMHFDKPLVKDLLVSGITLMLQGSILQISSALRQAAVNGFDEYVVTGIATGEKLIIFSWMTILALESAFLYFAAQNTGAGKIDRVKSGWKFTFLVMLAVGAVFAFLFIFFGKYFYGLFVGYGDDAKTVAITEYANSYIVSQMIFFPFMALLSSTRGAVKGMGKTFATIMCGALEFFAVTVAVIVANCLPLSDSMRLCVIYLSLPFSWILTSVSILILLIHTFKQKKKEVEILVSNDTEVESVFE